MNHKSFISKKNGIPLSMEDGTSSKITLFSPDDSTASSVFIIMPAMGVPGEFYRPLAENLQSAGFHAVTTDLRGVGNSSVRPSKNINFGYHEMITLDITEIIKTINKKLPNSPLFFIGHSLGGHLSALYSSLHSDQVKGIILIASSSLFFRSWGFPGCLKTFFGTQLAYLTSIILGYFPGDKVGFGGLEAKNVIRDWSHQALTGHYDILNSPYNFEKLLGQLKSKILALSFQGDSLAPKRAVKDLSNKMKMADITHHHLSPGDLEVDSLNHYNWVKHSKPIIKEIKKWIKKRYK